MSAKFQVSGANGAALFSLKLHRGDGMTLLAMNWKNGTPPKDFVGFAIEYKEPGGDKFFGLKNRWRSPVRAAKSIPTSSSPGSRPSRNSAGCISRAMQSLLVNSFIKLLRYL